jgi:hypothetical protein
MSPRPPAKQPDGSTAAGDPRRVAHDQLRDADDGIYRGRDPSDLDMRQPHERDESADGKPIGAVSDRVRQGERDLAEGRVDTDQRGAAVRNFNRRNGGAGGDSAPPQTDSTKGEDR